MISLVLSAIIRVMLNFEQSRCDTEPSEYNFIHKLTLQGHENTPMIVPSGYPLNHEMQIYKLPVPHG